MALNGFTPNTKIESTKVGANFTNLSNHGRWVSLQWIFSGTITTQTSKDVKEVPDNVLWSRAVCYFGTAPVGANAIIDIEYSDDGGSTWTTIFTTPGNRPTVLDGQRTGNTITIEVATGTGQVRKWRAKIAQIGSSTPGADLIVILQGQYVLD